MILSRGLLLTVLLFFFTIPVLLGAWYYNISIDATKSFLFNGVKIDLNYTFYEFGRIKRGLLVFEVENATDVTIKVSPPKFADRKFYLSPDHVFKKPLLLNPGQKLAFYTFTSPTSDKIVLNISGKNFILPMNWTQKLYDQEKWKWFVMRVGRVSNLFFWVSVILYISNRVKNM